MEWAKWLKGFTVTYVAGRTSFLYTMLAAQSVGDMLEQMKLVCLTALQLIMILLLTIRLLYGLEILVNRPESRLTICPSDSTQCSKGAELNTPYGGE